MNGGEAPGLQIVGDHGAPIGKREGHLRGFVAGRSAEVEHSMAGAYVEHRNRQQRRFFLHRVQP